MTPDMLSSMLITSLNGWSLISGRCNLPKSLAHSPQRQRALKPVIVSFPGWNRDLGTHTFRQTCISARFISHAGLVNSQVGIAGQSWGVKQVKQSGIGKHHSVTTATQILTGKVACSTGVPYGKKHKPGNYGVWKNRGIKSWRRMKESHCSMEIKVLNQITATTLAALSASVCKVFIAPEMVLILLYLAICCDVLKHHGELGKSWAHRQGAAAKPSSCTAENGSGSL